MKTNTNRDPKLGSEKLDPKQYKSRIQTVIAESKKKIDKLKQNTQRIKILDLGPHVQRLLYKEFPTETWRTLKPKCPLTHKKIRIYESVRTHESNHISFVHPNQRGIERTCRSVRLLPVQAPT